MRLFLGSDEQIAEMVEKAVRRAREDAADSMTELFGASAKLKALQQEVAKLEIERDKKQEEFARREREVEHKVGLERKRQEFEITQAKRETEVKVREQNLQADKDRFKAEMEFQRGHLQDEIKSLRELVGQMLQRLPSAEIIVSGTVGKE